MPWRKDILFTKKERLVIGLLLFITLCFQYFGNKWHFEKLKRTKTLLIHSVSAPVSHKSGLSNDTLPKKDVSKKNSPDSKRTQLSLTPDFNIDPNTADSIKLILWGFSRYVVSNILAYRAAGGRFRQYSDLEKIYGLDKSFLASRKALLEFPSSTTHIKKMVNINDADSIELQQLHGIGPVLSARCVKYRELLGGFYQNKQILEVYGISEEVLKNNEGTIICTGSLDSLHINAATSEELSIHPYLDWNISRNIIRYRQANGLFDSVSQLQNLHLMSDSLFEKIRPYISISVNK